MMLTRSLREAAEAAEVATDPPEVERTVLKEAVTRGPEAEEAVAAEAAKTVTEPDHPWTPTPGSGSTGTRPDLPTRARQSQRESLFLSCLRKSSRSPARMSTIDK